MYYDDDYKPGDFGYWWTRTMGREDIKGGEWPVDICCSQEGITNLYGAPRKVIGNFDCGDNQLISLEHCPETVTGDFDCRENRIASLEHCPKSVGADFYCDNNVLISLEYCPETVRGFFYCNGNKINNLTHAPHEVNGSFECENNPIEDPLSEIIDNNIVAKDYKITEQERLTFEDFETEKRKRAKKRQLGPFAITKNPSKSPEL